MLAPYSKSASHHFETFPKNKIALEVFIGQFGRQEAIRCGANGEFVACLPMGDSVMKYEWPVQDQEVHLWHTGGLSQEQCNEVAGYLMYVGAKKIWIFDGMEFARFFENPA